MSRHRARKRFGQHFLTDPGVIDAIIAAVAARDDQTVVEIGPGQGAITKSLASRAKVLHAIELDRDLVASLKRSFDASDNVIIHEADALKFDFGALGVG